MTDGPPSEGKMQVEVRDMEGMETMEAKGGYEHWPAMEDTEEDHNFFSPFI